MADSIVYRYGLLLFILLGLFSCKSKKEILISADKKSITDILKVPYDYSWYEAKAKIKLESSQESLKGTLNLRMRRDSAILMAVKKIGIEGGRTLITKDSVTHIDRINHNYYINHIDNLKSHGISLSYDYAQTILSGTSPIINQGAIIDSIYTQDKIVIKTMINDMLHELSYDIHTGLLTRVSFKDNFSLSGSWTYSDYRLVSEKIYLPYQRIFQIETFSKNNNDEKLILELNFSNIEIDNPKPLRINIPDSYNRIY